MLLRLLQRTGSFQNTDLVILNAAPPPFPQRLTRAFPSWGSERSRATKNLGLVCGTHCARWMFHYQGTQRPTLSECDDVSKEDTHNFQITQISSAPESQNNIKHKPTAVPFPSRQRDTGDRLEQPMGHPIDLPLILYPVSLAGAKIGRGVAHESDTALFIFRTSVVHVEVKGQREKVDLLHQKLGT